LEDGTAPGDLERISGGNRNWSSREWYVNGSKLQDQNFPPEAKSWNFQIFI